MMNQIKNIILSVVSIIIVLILSEFILRFFIKPIPSGWGWEDSPRRYLSNYSNDTANELGLRGQKISYNENDYIVLLVGDSQVESATSSPDTMPEKFLQSYLAEVMKREVKVFSIAASGWGQDQQLLALEKYYENYRADLVLIWSTPKNDFWENTFPDRSLTKIAGHLKPTYKLVNEYLSGPHFEPNRYYQNSVLLQLFYTVLQTLKNETLEQLVLKDWIKNLPIPHNQDDFKLNISERKYTQVGLNQFSQDLPDYSDYDSIIVVLYEDFLNSRSHFSPFGKVLSNRDNYLISITQKLFENIYDLSISNHSAIFVFYPAREKYDLRYSRCIKYIKNPSCPEVIFPVRIDYLNTLKKAVRSDILISWNLDSEKDLCVSSSDRHLSAQGNELAMQQLAILIKSKHIK